MRPPLIPPTRGLTPRCLPRREEPRTSRLLFCPRCGAGLVGENAVESILAFPSGHYGYDCSCQACGWSGGVFPDDEKAWAQAKGEGR